MKKRIAKKLVVVGTVVLVFTSLLFAPHVLQWDNTTKVETQRSVAGPRIERPQPSENNIFFIEGSCAQNRKNIRQDREQAGLQLDTRAACSIESTARANPDMKIYLFSSCPFDENTLTSLMEKEIFSEHKNVYVWHQSLESLFEKSDLQDFFASQKMQDSLFKTQSSNVIRLLMLQKFGGTYLDLDFIVRRPLSLIAPNSVGLETSILANNAALRFGLNAVGRKVADMFVEELKMTFNGTVWAHNGPALTTGVMKKLCKLKRVRPISGEECQGFTIYDTEVFYPINVPSWKNMYDAKWTEKVLKMIENSTAVHLWNSMARLEKWKKPPDLFRDSNQPITVLQRINCPISHSYNKNSTKHSKPSHQPKSNKKH